ncbi:hypothetical protein [Acinetobacter courvalinii]|uniref:hypothetical protein n=1 Tax=Acinetobacter courvalinii TaxID=280147 RepID=UPI0021D19FDD|nr:hypothetical protein [Acinetobacter courvalinii]MCU4369582.1 fimbrial protein [Acinetobacter courvalinii]MCU4447787.1 fimbrial protein [Acinetobacter courvalinii]
MKALSTTLAAGLCIFAATQVSAAKIDINPLGEMTILPVENLCEVSISNPDVDYGVLSRWQLQDVVGRQVSFGKRTLTLSVVCPFKQTMRVVLRSSRSQEGQLQFGDQGRMSVRVIDAELEGKSTELGSINSEGILKGASKDHLYLRPDFGMVATQNGQPIKGKTFTARLEIEPLMSEKAARVTSLQVSEANFTLELIK